MVTPTLINDETAKVFLENLKQKRFMVCFVYYDFGREQKPEDICLDIAKTSYRDDGRFGIQCRGTGYMDYIDFEYGKQIEVIKMIIHSFIECDEPVIKTGNAQQTLQPDTFGAG